MEDTDGSLEMPSLEKFTLFLTLARKELDWLKQKFDFKKLSKIHKFKIYIYNYKKI